MFADRVEKKTVRVSVYTTGQLKLEGRIFVPKALRLIDELNASHQEFIAVADAEVSSLDSPAGSSQGFMLLNKRQIVCIVLHEDDVVADDV